tara:strand:+ start:5023 stop:5646 length:624 start_codon:yes stop_codon:yes gene_type:complete
MSLKELKQEIRELPSIKSDISDFKKNWLQPLRKGQKSHIVQEQLHQMHPDDKSHVHASLKDFYGQFASLHEHTALPEKLQSISAALVEMKLLSLRGAECSGKMDFLQAKVLQDPEFSIGSVISQVKTFDDDLNNIETMYHDINGYLHQTLSLEHSVALLELPHYTYLKSLQLTSNKQKKIVKKLGREFVSLQRKLKLQKQKQKRASD